jgi:hypothetical protein
MSPYPTVLPVRAPPRARPYESGAIFMYGAGFISPGRIEVQGARPPPTLPPVLRLRHFSGLRPASKAESKLSFCNPTVTQPLPIRKRGSPLEGELRKPTSYRSRKTGKNWKPSNSASSYQQLAALPSQVIHLPAFLMHFRMASFGPHGVPPGKLEIRSRHPSVNPAEGLA